jgi:hypothetical protein
MNYKLLQQRIKPYKQAGYTNIRLNSKKNVLELEYNRLLQLGLSQEQLEQAIANRDTDRIEAVDPIAVYASPDHYSLQLIKNKVFQLAQVPALRELKQNYPIIKEQKFNFRYKSAWVKCLKLIAEITEKSRENEEFYQAVEKAVEIELKSKNDEFYRHETPDLDLYTLLSDHHLVGSAWEKNESITNSLKRAYVLNKCREAGLDPHLYSLI